jgi:hypothetical protein
VALRQRSQLRQFFASFASFFSDPERGSCVEAEFFFERVGMLRRCERKRESLTKGKEARENTYGEQKAK